MISSVSSLIQFRLLEVRNFPARDLGSANSITPSLDCHDLDCDWLSLRNNRAACSLFAYIFSLELFPLIRDHLSFKGLLLHLVGAPKLPGIDVRKVSWLVSSG